MKPIEYIGPVPNKKKPKPKFGGWIIVLLVTLFVGKFAWPFFEGVAYASQDQPSAELATEVWKELGNSPDPAKRIAGMAIKRTNEQVSYDSAYYRLPYPLGDIPNNKGMNTDLVIRALRAGGLDLQKEIHEYMKDHYDEYPQLWSQKSPDPNIDHRRIENLNRYLQRHQIPRPATRKAVDYAFGNVVVWQLPQGEMHIGIVVPGPGVHHQEKWVVHNLNDKPVWSESLFDYHIIGNFTIEVQSSE